MPDENQLDPDWYRVESDGTVRTIWHDELPTVEESLRSLVAFQRANYPYVDYADSLLTCGPISQIRLHPLTGCWETFNYERNSYNLANPKNGYGIIYDREFIFDIDPVTGEKSAKKRRGSRLSHMVIWRLAGREYPFGKQLNHLCNYTRCCNPGHLELTDPDTNRAHGHKARRTIRAMQHMRGAEYKHLPRSLVNEMNLSLGPLHASIHRQMDECSAKGPVSQV